MAKKPSKKAIKEMEQARREAAEKAVEVTVPKAKEQSAEVKEEAKISFDVWWMMTYKKAAGKLPTHIQNVVRADFKGRGLGNKETRATFDAALVKFGIKL